MYMGTRNFFFSRNYFIRLTFVTNLVRSKHFSLISKHPHYCHASCWNISLHRRGCAETTFITAEKSDLGKLIGAQTTSRDKKKEKSYILYVRARACMCECFVEFTTAVCTSSFRFTLLWLSIEAPPSGSVTDLAKLSAYNTPGYALFKGLNVALYLRVLWCVRRAFAVSWPAFRILSALKLRQGWPTMIMPNGSRRTRLSVSGIWLDVFRGRIPPFYTI